MDNPEKRPYRMRKRHVYTDKRIWEINGAVATTTIREFTTKVDTDMVPLLRNYIWVVAGYGTDWPRILARCNINGKLQSLAMSRIIMGLPIGVVDHINRDTLDNRRENLRIVSQTQNQLNTNRKDKNSTSIYKGVNKISQQDKWSSRMKINKKVFHIGTFNTEKEAAIAFDLKAFEINGEYAYLNFPDLARARMSQRIVSEES